MRVRKGNNFTGDLSILWFQYLITTAVLLHIFKSTSWGQNIVQGIFPWISPAALFIKQVCLITFFSNSIFLSSYLREQRYLDVCMVVSWVAV